MKTETDAVEKEDFPAIHFMLNKTQNRQLTRLWDLVWDAHIKGKNGMVLMRIEELDEFRKPEDNKSFAVFVPHKYAKKIYDIMLEYSKDFKQGG